MRHGLADARFWTMLALAGIATALLAGCGGSDVASVAARGAQVYAEHCSTCHQFDGRGYDDVYPNLAGNPIVQLRDPGPVIEMVTHGRGSMPPFEHELTEAQLAQVITYIRGAWGNAAPAVTPGQVN